MDFFEWFPSFLNFSLYFENVSTYVFIFCTVICMCFLCSFLCRRCLRCGEGTILANNPVDFTPSSIWKCQTCGHTTTFEAINKLFNYFMDKFKQPQVNSSVEALEDMLEKSARLLHPNHYVVTLVRIKMNVAYIGLTHRMFGSIYFKNYIPIWYI